jgi:hypothetical protein
MSFTPLPGQVYGTQWFRIASGQHEGRLHLSGWHHSAIKGEDLSKRGDGWFAYASCPLCWAMVVADGKNPGHGDLTWAHERWHARTDFPVPGELLTDEDRKRGYAPG